MDPEKTKLHNNYNIFKLVYLLYKYFQVFLATITIRLEILRHSRNIVAHIIPWYGIKIILVISTPHAAPIRSAEKEKVAARLSPP